MQHLCDPGPETQISQTVQKFWAQKAADPVKARNRRHILWSMGCTLQGRLDCLRVEKVACQRLEARPLWWGHAMRKQQVHCTGSTTNALLRHTTYTAWHRSHVSVRTARDRLTKQSPALWSQRSLQLNSAERYDKVFRRWPRAPGSSPLLPHSGLAESVGGVSWPRPTTRAPGCKGPSCVGRGPS